METKTKYTTTVTYYPEEPETLYNPKHSYNHGYAGQGCSECCNIDNEVRHKQQSILTQAVRIGLPRNYARDLLIDCDIIAEVNPETFALLLRENGTQLAYDRQSASSLRYWVGNDDMEAFFLWKPVPPYEGRPEGLPPEYSLQRVHRIDFLKWCDDRDGGAVRP